MNIFKENKNFISGIHNYCDRWCKRCTFTARCRVAASENELTDEQRDIKNDAFWRNLLYMFSQAKMILERAEELGVESEPTGAAVKTKLLLKNKLQIISIKDASSSPA